MTIDADLKARIDSLVQDKPVVLFMKGNRRMPRCGFSARVVGILDGLLDDYETVDVLADPDIRQGIKDYSDWPTIPQLYVRGEFQGGCDIVTEMAGSGELHSLLGIELQEVETPTVTLTDDAAAALKEALQGTPEGELLRLRIPSNFRYELNLGPKQFGDVEVQAGGYTLLLDRDSASRGDGTVIDYVTGRMGAGFKISNPNEPAPVRQLQPAELKEMIEGPDEFELLDVRSEAERAIVHIGGQLLDADADERLQGLDRKTKLVFYCRTGSRSNQAAEHFRGMGFVDVSNLAGGLHAWADQVDPSVPRY